jgi:hypothetical protein
MFALSESEGVMMRKRVEIMSVTSNFTFAALKRSGLDIFTGFSHLVVIGFIPWSDISSLQTLTNTLILQTSHPPSKSLCTFTSTFLEPTKKNQHLQNSSSSFSYSSLTVYIK